MTNKLTNESTEKSHKVQNPAHDDYAQIFSLGLSRTFAYRSPQGSCSWLKPKEGQCGEGLSEDLSLWY